jgi:hypothetical protein
MADSSVSPYLLRPLRTLEQVLGGRSGAVLLRPEQVKGCQPPTAAAHCASSQTMKVVTSHSTRRTAPSSHETANP